MVIVVGDGRVCVERHGAASKGKEQGPVGKRNLFGI